METITAEVVEFLDDALDMMEFHVPYSIQMWIAKSSETIYLTAGGL